MKLNRKGFIRMGRLLISDITNQWLQRRTKGLGSIDKCKSLVIIHGAVPWIIESGVLF